MNLSPLPIQKFFADNGRPLAGGLLFTYAAGTNDKIATYVDSSGGTPNTNPVVLDFRGECRLWLDPSLAYKFVLSPPGDTDPPTKPIWTVDDITVAPINFENSAVDTGTVNNISLSIPQITAPVAFTRIVFQAANTNTGPTTISINGGTARALTWQSGVEFMGAEVVAGAIYEAVFDGARWQLEGPTLITAGRPVYDASIFGASPDADAATNSTAIQAAADMAYNAGGGIVFIAAGEYEIDTPIVVRQGVSIVGAGRYATKIRKATDTPSPIYDDSIKFWDSQPVGYPVCCFHFVASDDTTSWSYAICRDIAAVGNTTSPNTTSTEYGFFFRGAVGAAIRDTIAEYVQVGYFFGAGATITSDVSGNLAANVQRGFYQHFATSTTVRANYANQYRYAGYFGSYYYSLIDSNAADNGGGAWKVGTTEVCIAYQFNACRGATFVSNGCETHNGSVWLTSNCISSRFINNLGLDVSSDYTGGSDIVLWENDGNNSCVYEDNRIQTSGMTGTPGRHFMYKITTEFGNYVWQRNRFVDNIADTTDTSSWANSSGTIIETQAVQVVNGTFTATLTGVDSVQQGTVTYRRMGTLVILDIPTIQGTSNSTSATLTGMPTELAPATTQDVLGVTSNNSSFGLAYIQIETTGVITLFSSITSATFANSGIKGIGAITVSYRIA